MIHAYPAQLAAFVRSRWGEGEDTLPEARDLEALLSIAYQASLLRDEDRPVNFRLLLGDPDAFDANAGPPRGLHCLRFSELRAFDEHELRRLSQAAKFHRALIGVCPAPDAPPVIDREPDDPPQRFRIWGILQSGPRWLPSARGVLATTPSIPLQTLIIRVLAPGRLEVAKGDHTIAELRGGTVTEPGMDVFESRWLPARFASVRADIIERHRASMEPHENPTRTLDVEVVRHISQDVLRRALAVMREARHGGTIVFLPPEALDEHGALRPSNMEIKYLFAPEAPRRRYRTVMFALLRALAGLEPRERLVECNEAIFELSQLIAALTDVDGAVVMTKRFELVGFGAEITGALPQVARVARALDLEGTTRAREATDGVGTRHRSVYRLCAAVPDAVAIVVSQDGTIRFVAYHAGEVTFWDHSSSGDI
jgi:hypothetical protein